MHAAPLLIMLRQHATQPGGIGNAHNPFGCAECGSRAPLSLKFQESFHFYMSLSDVAIDVCRGRYKSSFRGASRQLLRDN